MRSIWAVAINTIKQALRMKVAVVFMILLFVLLPVLGASATGDETLKGRLQTFVSYGLSLTSFLLCILTIIVSVYSVTSDIEQRQIYTVITKPIRRFQLLLGKLLGVLLLDIALLALFSGIIFIIAVYTPTFTKPPESELIEADNEFFTARAALSVPPVDVTDAVKARYEQLKELDQLPPGYTTEQTIAELTKQAQLAKRAAAVGGMLVWEFNNVKPLSDSMFIRFKYDIFPNPPDSQVYGRWMAGDWQFIKYGQRPKTPIYDQLHKNAARTFHEVEFPAEVVPEDGHLAIAFQNVPYNSSTVIFPPDGLEVLYKADTFAGNFVRAVFLILCRLIFLACLGLFASSFLSFPVAILLCLWIFCTASISGFINDSFSLLSYNVGVFYSYTIQWVVGLLPQFDKFNPTTFIVPAKLVNWSFLAKCVFTMVCIKAFLALILGLIIFRYREIARITV
ncbi:ABC transporter permease [Planctomycetota bacterium]